MKRTIKTVERVNLDNLVRIETLHFDDNAHIRISISTMGKSGFYSRDTSFPLRERGPKVINEFKVIYETCLVDTLENSHRCITAIKDAFENGAFTGRQRLRYEYNRCKGVQP